MAAAPTPLGSPVPRDSDAPGAHGSGANPLPKLPGAGTFTRVAALANDPRDWRKVELTLGERHWIKRIRRHQDQHQAAARLGITRWQYQLLERVASHPEVVPITNFEWCRVMRRRAGKLQREVAEELKVHRVWVHKMECGLENCDPLIWYWEQ